MIGIDLFAGAGGMSLGAKLAGIKTIMAVEKDVNAAKSYALNFPDTTVIIDDIKNAHEFQFEKTKNDQVVLYGGPPCQGFSDSNQKNRGLENPKNWLFKEFISKTKKISPDWVVIENVKGLLSQNAGFFFDEIISGLNKLGYTISYRILNSEDVGVPQKRERVFIVGSLHGIAIDLSDFKKQGSVSVRDAISDLPSLKVGNGKGKMRYKFEPDSDYARLMRGSLNEVDNNLVTNNSKLVQMRYKYVPEGGNWEDIPERLMANYKDRTRCHTGIYHRLNWDSPSKVIGNFRKNMMIHPKEHRGLSVREAARIQSFPDSFSFVGSIGFQQQQVADAVPPLLAKSVFENLLSANH